MNQGEQEEKKKNPKETEKAKFILAFGSISVSYYNDCILCFSRKIKLIANLIFFYFYSDYGYHYIGNHCRISKKT